MLSTPATQPLLPAADTWGVPSRVFLILYVLGWVAIITTYVVRRRAARRGQLACPPRELSAWDIAAARPVGLRTCP